MTFINKKGYLCRTKSNIPRCTTSKRPEKDWFSGKHIENKKGARVFQIRLGIITIPKELEGYKLRFKVEVI